MTHTTSSTEPAADENHLARARRRDTARRRQQVHDAIAQLRSDGAVITVSSIARPALVHRTSSTATPTCTPPS